MDIQQARQNLKTWESSSGEWVEETKTAYNFVAGNQWSDEEKAGMGDRPAVTFNQIASMLRGICGLEANNRQEVRYLPRETHDNAISDICNSSAKYVRELTDADHEEGDAFRDSLICGIGWTETYIDYTKNPDGDIVVERIDPLEMKWDNASKRRGLHDSRWRARIRKLPLEDVKLRWPDKAEEIQSQTEEEIESGSLHVVTETAYQNNSASSPHLDKHRVTVVQYQYFEDEDVVMVSDGQREIEVGAKKYAKLAERIPLLSARKLRKRKYKQLIFSGEVLLEDADLKTDDFTLQPITGSRDRETNTWYGIVRDLIDPQRWSNKFFSLGVETFATQAKGGLIAEEHAFKNPRQAQEDWADASKVVIVRDGKLNAVKERQMGGLPPAAAQLFSFTNELMPRVSGVNLEFLGMADRAQAGVLEHQRKQAAIATLGDYFGALSLYRKRQGRVLIKMIREYISDGRMIRIVGKDMEQYVPLMKLPDTITFDVIVDEAPMSADTKARTWMAITEILPAATKMGIPIPPTVLDYAPIPASLSSEWKRLLIEKQQGQLPPEHAQQMQRLQQEMQRLIQENQQLKTSQSVQMQKNQGELMVKREAAQGQLALDRDMALAELRQAAQQWQQEFALEMRKMMMEAMRPQVITEGAVNGD